MKHFEVTHEGAPPRFHDRREAGRLLAGLLSDYRGREDAFVLAIPRGGVPVALEVAEALSLPLDVLAVQKVVLAVHSAWQEPPVAGAIAHDGTRSIDARHFAALHLPAEELEDAIATARHELERREAFYRDGGRFPDLRGRTVILVDDGIETGVTMRAAIAAVRSLEPKEIVVAIPLGTDRMCTEIAPLADRVVCLMPLSQFAPTRSRYDQYPKVGDDEVRALMEEKGHKQDGPAALAHSS